MNTEDNGHHTDGFVDIESLTEEQRSRLVGLRDRIKAARLRGDAPPPWLDYVRILVSLHKAELVLRVSVGVPVEDVNEAMIQMQERLFLGGEAIV